MEKERIDVLLTLKGLSDSREKAKNSILNGNIFVDDKKIDKPSTKVNIDSKIEIRGEKLKYVSRGGIKLESALTHFNIDLNNKICMDIGASTGGFSDCMLRHGAKKVYAIDVGYSQLKDSIRNDDRVVVFERTNIRYLEKNKLDDEIDFASIDVSFISLKTIMNNVINLVSSQAELVALIKPQFEAGRAKIGKNGIVKDKKVHIEVIKSIVEFLEQNKLNIINLLFSPIKGGEGNIEFLIHFTPKLINYRFNKDKIVEVVNVARFLK